MLSTAERLLFRPGWATVTFPPARSPCRTTAFSLPSAKSSGGMLHPRRSSPNERVCRWRIRPGFPTDGERSRRWARSTACTSATGACCRRSRRRAEAAGRRSVLVTFDPHPLDRAARALPAAAHHRRGEEGDPRGERARLRGLPRVHAERCPGTSRGGSWRRSCRTPRRARSSSSATTTASGRDRSGDPDTLRGSAKSSGSTVDVVPPFSRTAERCPPAASAPRSSAQTWGGARDCLGRPYSVRGVVVRGDGRGRQLGFPTANLSVGEREKLIPPQGIYAVRALLRSGTYAGALHLGPRPTFEGSPPTIELHLLDFEGDLYGEESASTSSSCLARSGRSRPSLRWWTRCGRTWRPRAAVDGTPRIA